MKNRRAVLAAAALGLCALHSASHAQAGWPNRPIKIISPFAAGGVGENMFRVIAPILQEKFGQPFVIEIRTGAGGNIGMAEVVRAAPDGYTFVLATTGSFAANQFLYKNIGFDPVTQLEPVTAFAKGVSIAYASKGAGVKTLKEAAAKAKQPGARMNYASPGAGSVTHLMGAWFALVTGAPMEHVAYRGTAPMMQGLLANDVQLAFSTLGAPGPHIKAGNLIPLAVMDSKRLPELPDLPTLAEAGFPDQSFSSWWALAAPKGIDPQIVNRLAAEIRAAVARPDVAAKIASFGHQTMSTTPQETAAMIRSEAAFYKSLIQRTHITLD